MIIELQIAHDYLGGLTLHRLYSVHNKHVAVSQRSVPFQRWSLPNKEASLAGCFSKRSLSDLAFCRSSPLGEVWAGAMGGEKLRKEFLLQSGHSQSRLEKYTSNLRS